MSAEDREDVLGDYTCCAANRLCELYGNVHAWCERARCELYGSNDGHIGSVDEDEAEDLLAWFGDITEKFESM